ncbi:MAG: hypothetical protein KDJ41_15550 [Hyphomicrobiaceae bacterium]|nr:hypothetical protein [Hyphomicrobiaceae bacterium]
MTSEIALVPGAGRLEYWDPRPGLRRPIPLWTYTPAGFGPESPIVLVMHGMKRNADEYRDNWAEAAEAEGCLVVAPEFSKAAYPESRDYNYGNVFKDDERLLPRDEWLFPVLDRIFLHVKARAGSRREQYALFGHSAGGQLVHRLVTLAFSPLIEIAISANAGSYTMPVMDVRYPFGLGGTSYTTEQERALVTRPLVILLGDSDNDPNHHSLPRDEAAMRQGPHRFGRGQAYFEAGRQLALKHEVPFAWRLEIAPGVAHSNAGLARQAARIASRR